MKIFNSVTALFYPILCINCNNILLEKEELLCIKCTHELPIINIKDVVTNEITSVFFGKVPIRSATSFLYFSKEGITQKLIHQLKYKGNEKVGSYFGKWFGNYLNEEKIFTNINAIVPVPLHPKKLKKRGYNQVTKFGEELSTALNTEYTPNILIRSAFSETQTYKQRTERFTNTETLFSLTDITYFENKHILLIDDVITTGATLEACCNELLKTKNITISIATLAFTKLN